MIRSTFAGMTTAFTALQANQKRLDISGQNLANMNTPGYTRQSLQTSSLNYNSPISHYMNNSSLVAGFGVHMDSITQIRDPYLDVQYRNQIHKSGYSDALQKSLDSLANVFDESHVEGMWQAIKDIQSSLINMQDPAKVNDPIFESELRSRMQALTNLLNDASTQLDAAEKAEFSKLDGTGTSEQGAVQRVNDILRQIGELNRHIKQNQIFGHESLELMDERNMLLDELASYIPIEVSYYKDLDYDGKDDGVAGRYHLDENGNIIGKREWPDDLRVEMHYTDANGVAQKITLVEGTTGKGNENYGQVEITGGSLDDPTKVALMFHGFQSGSGGQTAADIPFEATNTPAQSSTDATTAFTTVGNRFPNGSGSIQASLDMLWRVGTTKDGTGNEIEDVKGYEFYRNQLNVFAKTFATVVNTINNKGGDGDLLSTKDGGDFLASNITINPDWSNGNVHVGTTLDNIDGNQNETVLNLLEAMKTTFSMGTTSIQGANTKNPITFTDLNLENNSFADFMNHVATILANDSYSNSNAFKTQMSVLNGIQESRDSISGVSLDEEASNMMMYMSAYNAASRLMTTLDQALDVLINNTGTVGR